MIHILQNTVDKIFLITPHERSVQELIEARIIRKSFFLDRTSLFSDRFTHVE